MRLGNYEVDVIKGSFRRHFSEQEHLWLFGSRVDDAKRGGDIDLYIETNETDIDTIYRKKVDFVSDIWMKIGEQKIDVVLTILNRKIILPIYDIARQTGIKLI